MGEDRSNNPLHSQYVLNIVCLVDILLEDTCSICNLKTTWLRFKERKLIETLWSQFNFLLVYTETTFRLGWYFTVALILGMDHSKILHHSHLGCSLNMFCVIDTYIVLGVDILLDNTYSICNLKTIWLNSRTKNWLRFMHCPSTWTKLFLSRTKSKLS